MFQDVSIDCIEEKFAVCEDDSGEKHLVQTDKLPEGVKEGDIITLFRNGRVEFNELKTKQRRKKILNLEDKLFNSK